MASPSSAATNSHVARELAGLMAAGYLRLQRHRAKSRQDAKIQPQNTVEFPGYPPPVERVYER
jgi:hypothetical protein